MRPLFITFNDIRSQSPRYRGFWPAEAIRRAGADVRCLPWRAVRRADLAWAEITIFVRVVNAVVRAWFPRRVLRRLDDLWAAARQRGPVLCDLDDLVFVPGHERGRPELAAWQTQRLREADALLVTTQPLADQLRTLNERIHIVPNCVDVAGVSTDSESVQSVQSVDSPSARLQLGWCCGVTHADDESTFLGIARAVASALSGEVEFALWGRPSAALLDQMLALAAPHRVLPMVPWTRIGAMWSQFDVNLVPLAPTPLNACKSVVHWLEPGALGIPSVASPRGEFTSVIRSGQNGLLADAPDEWAAQVETLVRLPELRRRIGGAARAEILATRTLAQQGPRLRAVLEQVLASGRRA